MNTKSQMQRFIKRCPVSGKIKGFRFSGLLLPLSGFLALLWIIIRIIPKPSRAVYPCMQAAMPLASGFVIWTAGLIISGLAFFKARALWRRGLYIYAAVFILTSVSIIQVMDGRIQPVKASSIESVHISNQPIGTGRGTFPGRVVWVHNQEATNENCDPDAYEHGWFLDENNDQQVIDQMLSNGIQVLTNTRSDSAAWRRIFEYHNEQRGKGTAVYQSGEKIFIKINVTSSWSGNIDLNDFSKTENQYYGISETSPHLVLSVLRQLVYTAGVPQDKIYIGDPMKHIYKHCYDLWHSEFPDVHYLDNSESHLGREKAAKSRTVKIEYSDRGKVLRTGTWSDATAGDPVTNDYLYSIFEEVEYLLNIPTLKGHKHAGITAFAKNHFGSHTRSDAKHLHGGLVSIDSQNPQRNGYGLYRVQVDLMGHYLLGRKNLFYLMDALWTSDYEIDGPDKWQTAPFNDDWMSSIFLSQDPVAIESVGFDFLRAEYTVERGLAAYPQMDGVDDYLHQAADSVNRPDDIQYDPENDGSLLPSLGVHEHWNDNENKQYSRNLGLQKGIELVKVSSSTEIADNNQAVLPDQINILHNYPNPFNPATVIIYKLSASGSVELDIYDTLGKKAANLVNERQASGVYEVKWNASGRAGGVYFLVLKISGTGGGNSRPSVFARKMMLLK